MSRTRKLPLSRGLFALVDSSDYADVSRYKWSVSFTSSKKIPYAIRKVKNKNGKKKTVYLHIYLMQPEKGFVVHHINEDGLDNRRSNLAVLTYPHHGLTHRKKKTSLSKFKGVSISSKTKKYLAQFNSKGKFSSIYGFDNEYEAARIYDSVIRKKGFKFARYNYVRDLSIRQVGRFLENNKSRFVFAVFRRSDGSLREMVIQTDTIVKSKNGYWAAIVKDIKNGFWRSIRLDRLICLKLDKAYFFVKIKGYIDVQKKKNKRKISCQYEIY